MLIGAYPLLPRLTMSAAIASHALKSALLVRKGYAHRVIKTKEPNFLKALDAWHRLCEFEEKASIQEDDHMNITDREQLMLEEWEHQRHEPTAPPGISFLESMPTIAWENIQRDKD